MDDSFSQDETRFTVSCLSADVQDDRGDAPCDEVDHPFRVCSKVR